MVIFYLMLYILAAFQLLHSYSMLPDVMATHFSAGGEANGFMPLSHFAGFHMGFVVFLSGLFYAAGWLVSKTPPRLLSIPNRDYWLAPARAAATMQRLRNDVSMMGLLAGLFAMAIDDLVIDANIGGGKVIRADSLHTIVVTAGVVMAFYLVFLLRRFSLPRDAGTGATGEKRQD
ncbi:MAG: DUF1648 domain-containing protein [Micavibrio sp.]|nr:DUF1648 domain-containing protein [Micavibrio sp.]